VFSVGWTRTGIQSTLYLIAYGVRTERKNDTRQNGRFIFGIYPGGVAGGDAGLLSGTADDPAKMTECLDALQASTLQGSTQALVIRVYDSFQDPDSSFAENVAAPANYAQFAVRETRPLDLVLQYRSSSADIEGYLAFVKERVLQHAAYLYSVQITEEPNFRDGPAVIDGPYPGVLDALTQGVVVAKQALRETGAGHVKVGFNATPTFGAAQVFWGQLKAASSAGFADALDFVGLDFFPDVFRRMAADGAPGDIASSVTGILETMRKVWLPQAGIRDSCAIHIAENGWPTGPGRSFERQAEVLETVIRTVHSLRVLHTIERYTLFSLRDVQPLDPEAPYDLFCYFGITDASYKKKPAFERFRSLIAELSSGNGF
jgi:hypothetical protein